MNSNILKMSELFIKTLREDPANAEIESHKLLLRAGYIRQIAPGIFSWLPLGLRVLNKINKIVREEMAKIGAQEVHFPKAARSALAKRYVVPSAGVASRLYI